LTSTTAIEIAMLGLTFVLCSIIGVERQISQKSAGVRTYILVGLGSAGFTLVSAYGFASLVGRGVQYDPARIAAQIVSGIGFLGAGVIFMRRDTVRGLTTAAAVWLTAAVGMACGAGMITLAIGMTALYLLAVVLLTPLARRLPSSDSRRTLIIRYVDGRGVLRDILTVASDMGYEATIRSTRQVVLDHGAAVVARMQFRGRSPLQALVTEFAELPGIEAVEVGARGDPAVD
jgi:putative Mg2+ transporter-C (MgtC) family protein